MKALNDARQKTSLRSIEEQLDRSANALDLETDIGFGGALRILGRVTTYFKLFKARITAKLTFITVESLFRLLVVPWPGKVVIDHVILGQPIPVDATG